MSDFEHDPFERVRGAGEQPYHARVSLDRNVRGELVGVTDADPVDAGPSDPPADEWDEPEWESEPALSIEQRLANVEQYLGPAAFEAERQAQLDRHEALVDQAHGMTAQEIAAHVHAATQEAVAERLGLTAQPPTLEETFHAGEEIAAAHLGERWPEVRERVFEELQTRPQWLLDVKANPTPAVLGQTFVSVASVLAQAEQARSHTADMKREAQTLTGGSSRPATQTGDEAYWERIKAASSGGYGT